MFESEQPLQVELSHFIDVAQGRSMPMVTGLQGLRALRLAEEIQSIMKETGRTFDFADAQSTRVS